MGERVSAMPDDGADPNDWDDEWNADDWNELAAADRDYRNEPTWAEWGVKLLAIAFVLPIVLVVLFLLLTLAF